MRDGISKCTITHTIPRSQNRRVFGINEDERLSGPSWANLAKNIIRLSEQIKFVITVLNSIAESTSQKTQETLSDYFANTEKLDQSINQLDQLKNRVARLNAAIRQLEK